MHIITRKRLNEFANQYPDVRNALAQWFHLMKQNNFNSFAELRSVFSSADQVGKLTVFYRWEQSAFDCSHTLR
jgi:mRNA interferase HigB